MPVEFDKGVLLSRCMSWPNVSRVAARIEATRQGLDIRYVVTNIGGGPDQNAVHPATGRCVRYAGRCQSVTSPVALMNKTGFCNGPSCVNPFRA